MLLWPRASQILCCCFCPYLESRKFARICFFASAQIIAFFPPSTKHLCFKHLSLTLSGWLAVFLSPLFSFFFIITIFVFLLLLPLCFRLYLAVVPVAVATTCCCYWLTDCCCSNQYRFSFFYSLAVFCFFVFCFLCFGVQNRFWEFYFYFFSVFVGSVCVCVLDLSLFLVTVVVSTGLCCEQGSSGVL
jgi:hypothetical protein